MSESEAGEKTEEPTGKRLEEAQKSGTFSPNRELDSMIILISAFTFLYISLPRLSQGIFDIMHICFSDFERPFNRHRLESVTAIAGSSIGWILFLFLITIAFMGTLVCVIQTGVHFKEGFIQFDITKLNPLPKIKSLFAPKTSFPELAKSFLKVLIVSFISYSVVRDNKENIIKMPITGLYGSLDLIKEIIYTILFRSLMWLLILAILDVVYRRYQTWQELKMTKQEVRDESKAQDGDPGVKHRIRNVFKQRLLQKSGIKDVPKADVVITNPDHYAIALKYVSGKMRAPLVLAKGQDEIAEMIKTEARKYNIPRVENRLLARTLYKLTKVGDEIPPQLYGAVAEILAFVYRIKQQHQ